jgi:hypothetical protein
MHAIQQAIEPPLPLREILDDWNQISAELNEAPRKRLGIMVNNG